jgi:hypothetical protein
MHRYTHTRAHVLRLTEICKGQMSLHGHQLVLIFILASTQIGY